MSGDAAAAEAAGGDELDQQPPWLDLPGPALFQIFAQLPQATRLAVLPLVCRAWGAAATQTWTCLSLHASSTQQAFSQWTWLLTRGRRHVRRLSSAFSGLQMTGPGLPGHLEDLFTKLQWLHLEAFRLVPGRLTALRGELLASLPRMLASLELCDVLLPADLVPMLHALPQLRHVLLARCTLPSIRRAAPLGAVEQFQGLPSLRSLLLDECRFGEPILLRDLLTLTQLTRLAARFCRVDGAVPPAAAAPGNCARLRVLELPFNNDPGLGTPEAIAFIAQCCSALEALDLTGCGVTNAGAAALGAQLPSCLSRLVLARNHVSAPGALAAPGARLSSLACLDLSAQQQPAACGDEALLRLVPALPRLQELRLAQSGATDAGVAAAAAALAGARLTELVLDDSPGVSDAVAAPAHEARDGRGGALWELRHLRVLGLARCRTSPRAIERLLSHLRARPAAQLAAGLEPLAGEWGAGVDGLE